MPYVAVAVLVLGVAYRALRWAKMPPHFRWTLYPYPQTAAGQIGFIAGEVLTFRSLRRANKGMWLGAWTFHISMMVTFLGLILLIAGAGAVVVGIGFAGLAFGSIYLLIFRLSVRRMRLLTTGVEILHLVLFLGIGITGLGTALGGVSLVDAQTYLRGLVTFSPAAAPSQPVFLTLLVLIEIFLLYFAFSRMIHMISKYFAFHTINWDRGAH
jgi:nitrate reductase gamma subunit